MHRARVAALRELYVGGVGPLGAPARHHVRVHAIEEVFRPRLIRRSPAIEEEP